MVQRTVESVVAFIATVVIPSMESCFSTVTYISAPLVESQEAEEIRKKVTLAYVPNFEGGITIGLDGGKVRFVSCPHPTQG
jgi:hypothetical protein